MAYGCSLASAHGESWLHLIGCITAATADGGATEEQHPGTSHCMGRCDHEDAMQRMLLIARFDQVALRPALT